MLKLPQDDKQLENLSHAMFELTHNDSWQRVRHWIEIEARRIAIENMTADGNVLKWNQGALQFLADFVEKLDKSGDLIDTIRNKHQS